MSARILWLVLLLAAGVTAGPGAAGAAVESTFDYDTEGWLILGDNDAEWLATGGNPGGCFSVNDLVTGQNNFASAPAKFLGDWSTCDGGDTLSFDVYFRNTSGGQLLTHDWLFRIAGPDGAAQGVVPAGAPAEDIWVRNAISLAAADWVMEAGTWEGLLANVTSLKLWVEYVNGGEIVRIDNVRLSADPVHVFTPCAASGFNAAGLDDWSYQGASSVSNPGDDGNAGGYLLFGDASGASTYAYAPSRFLGDWTGLEDIGHLTVDIRVRSASGDNLGAAEFVRLLGPGGVAHVSLEPGDLPTSGQVWKTFRFPLTASQWTLDSGTWAGLLADVIECRVKVEFFDGTESVGMDNFGRGLDSCPAIDEPVNVHAGDVSLCGVHSFVDVSGLAVDPSSGELYAAVRQTISAGGGVYTFSGPTPGVKLQSYENPASLLFDEDGDGYVAEDYSGVIRRFVGAESTMVWVSGFHSGDDDPFGMTFAPTGFEGANVVAGDILVADRGNSGADQIWAFSPDFPEDERLVKPDPGNTDWFDLVGDDQGRVWVADAFVPDRLFLLAPDGTFTDFLLGSPIGQPRSIVYDPVDAVLYVAGGDPHALYRVLPTDGTVTLVADGFRAATPAALELDAARRRLWLADQGGERAYEFCLPGWTAVGPPPAMPRIRLRATPNPASESTRLQFDLPSAADVRLEIYDVAGRRARLLAAGRLAAGPHAIQWDGRRQDGRRAESGVYFVRLEVDGRAAAARVALVR